MPEPEAAWARASVLRSLGGSKYEVRIDGVDDNDEPSQSGWGAGEVRQVDLAGTDGTTVLRYDGTVGRCDSSIVWREFCGTVGV